MPPIRVDVLHLNDVAGVPLTQFSSAPSVLTLHHPNEPALSKIYAQYPEIDYVAISEFQANSQRMPKVHVVHHGIPLNEYPARSQKSDYVAFLGRMAPCKGVHLAIDAALRAGIRLKIAGEVQPVFQSYWDDEVLPRIDGDRIEYLGEADHARKCDLLAGARALLFPDPVGRALRPGDDRGDGVRHAGARPSGRGGGRGRRERRERLDLQGRRRHRGPYRVSRDRPRVVPRSGRPNDSACSAWSATTSTSITASCRVSAAGPRR